MSGFAGRANTVDAGALAGLHYLGNYLRPLPRNNLTRMIENAYDWEHLPFVHPGSFADIELAEEGAWGWRCKVALPNGGGEQLIELLVDRARHYWATTVVEGPGAGVQIHTQANEREEGGIEVDVRFYLPQAPETDEQGAMILGVLQTQYATLYDEDEALMTGRQEALDARKEKRKDRPDMLDLGPEAELDRCQSHIVELASGRFAIRHHSGKWIAHAATCPHMLGPLADADIGEDGNVTCPWHGYRFNLGDGVEEHGRCGALPSPPVVREQVGRLIVGA